MGLETNRIQNGINFIVLIWVGPLYFVFLSNRRNLEELKVFKTLQILFVFTKSFFFAQGRDENFMLYFCAQFFFYVVSSFISPSLSRSLSLSLTLSFSPSPSLTHSLYFFIRWEVTYREEQLKLSCN